MSVQLSPEILRAFEEAGDGDTLRVETHKPEPEVKKSLTSLFDELPSDEFYDDLKKPAPAPEPEELPAPSFPEPAPAALGVYRPALALGATVSALLLTSAAAFACSARAGRQRSFCGERLPLLPRGARRTRRLALYPGADDAANDTSWAAADVHAELLHQDPSMDAGDAARVAATLEASARHLFAEGAPPPPAPAPAYDAAAPPQKTWAPAEFAEEYAKASRAHVLDVRAHVLRRLAETDVADPSADLADALEAAAGPGYLHAHARGAPEPLETAEGGFVLGLRDHLLRGAEGFLHQDPAIDIGDLAAIKAKARARLWAKMTDPRFLRE